MRHGAALAALLLLVPLGSGRAQTEGVAIPSAPACHAPLRADGTDPELRDLVLAPVPTVSTSGQPLRFHVCVASDRLGEGTRLQVEATIPGTPWREAAAQPVPLIPLNRSRPAPQGEPRMLGVLWHAIALPAGRTLAPGSAIALRILACVDAEGRPCGGLPDRVFTLIARLPG